MADVLIADGRDVYGPRHTPLFAGQLNPRTRRIPACTADDPGLLADGRETAGCGPTCQNLLFDLGLLDVLWQLTAATGDPKYQSAGQEYLRYLLGNCRHPVSGMIPWGEHVGYDLVRDEIRRGDYKGWHEVKAVVIPWDRLWAANPEAVRREIGVSFRNHICDEETFAFNRHADMGGRPNTGSSPCSLADSGGEYLYGWAWLGVKTGDARYIEWAQKMDGLYRGLQFAATRLFPSSEDRPHELWYADVLSYAVMLLAAGDALGAGGATLRDEAVGYVRSYGKWAYCAADRAFFDTLDTATGSPVIGASAHYPQIKRPKYLAAWQPIENSTNLIHVAVSAALVYSRTGDAEAGTLFRRALEGIDVRGQISAGSDLPPGHVAGVMLALVHTAKRDRNPELMRLAGDLAEYSLRRNRAGGLIVCRSGGREYYCARLGCGDLAAALLAFAALDAGAPDLMPPIRNPYGTMPW